MKKFDARLFYLSLLNIALLSGGLPTGRNAQAATKTVISADVAPIGYQSSTNWLLTKKGSSKFDSNAEITRLTNLLKGWSIRMLVSYYNKFDRKHYITFLASNINKYSTPEDRSNDTSKATAVFAQAGYMVRPDSNVVPAQATNSPAISDPDALSAFQHWYQSTRLARDSSSDPNLAVAHDFTSGNQNGIVSMIDPSGLGQNEIGFNEITQPVNQNTPNALGFELRAFYGTPVNTTSHASEAAYIVHGKRNTTGAFGVCPGCQRVSLSGKNVSELISSLWAVIFNDNKSIISLNFVMPNEDPEISALIDQAVESGFIVIAPTGNSGAFAASFPANHPRVIAVGSAGDASSATGSVDMTRVSNFSNSGAFCVAPGFRVPRLNTSTNPPNIGSISGTSYASAFVAGVAGLYNSTRYSNTSRFGYIDSEYTGSMQTEFFKQILSESTSFMADSKAGAGLIDAAKVIENLNNDANFRNNEISPNLSRAVAEWAGQNQVLQQISTRISANSPQTGFELNIGPWSFGGCFSSPEAVLFGLHKIESGQPRLFVNYTNTNLRFEHPDPQNDPNLIKAVLTTNVVYHGYLRFKLHRGPMCLSIFTDYERLNFVMNPVGNPVTTITLMYRLNPKGYELVSKEVTKPADFNLTFTNSAINLFPGGALPPGVDPWSYMSTLGQVLFPWGVIDALGRKFDTVVKPQIRGVITDWIEPSAQKELYTMIDRSIQESLAQDRMNPYAFFKKQSEGSWQQSSAADQFAFKTDMMAARFNGAHLYSAVTSAGTTYNKINQSNSVNAFRVEKPTNVDLTNSPPHLVPANPIFYNSTILTSDASQIPAEAPNNTAVYTQRQVLNAQLAHLFGKGGFNAANTDFANYTVSTGTTLSPGYNSVAFNFANMSALGVPELKEIPSSDPHYNKGYRYLVEMAFQGTVAVNGYSSENVIIVYQLPAYFEQYKTLSEETTYNVKDFKATTYEGRLAFDPNRFEAIVIGPSEWFEQFTVTNPTTNAPAVATLEDVGHMFHFSFGLMHVQRMLSSVSSSQNSLNVLLGQEWGCLKYIPAEINYAYQKQTGRSLLTLRPQDTGGCWNLNVGLFKPQRRLTEITQFTSQDAVKESFVMLPRIETDAEPRLEAAAVVRLTQENTVDPNSNAPVYATAAELKVQPTRGGSTLVKGASEAQYSIEGFYRTSFFRDGATPTQATIKLVSQLWQYRAPTGANEIIAYLPVYNSGGSTIARYSNRPIHVSAIGGDSSDKTRQAMCIPTLKARLTSQLATSTAEYKDAIYQTTRVTERQDKIFTGLCPDGVFQADGGNNWEHVDPPSGGGSSSGGGKIPPTGNPD